MGPIARIATPRTATPPAQAAEPAAKPNRSSATSMARERAERKREEKLANIREEVRTGSLVIRQMTDDERSRYSRRPVSRTRRDKR